MINQVISDSSLLPEVDNFYLDMNGIIHNCSHPNDNATSNKVTQREMMLGIFRYINHCVSEIVKPKKVLFLAIDGVAPRAKMNQQRARRFKAAQERAESIADAQAKGEDVDEDALFDSNCITPGTEFMDTVGNHIRYFLRKKCKEDPLWQNLEIVFSGHDVPGEGEHKIMQYIRDQRSKSDYSPNTRHCMYGGDADLIMLGLATHEPHFVLLREVVDFGANSRKSSARQVTVQQTREAQFQLLHLSVLREYIEVDLALGCGFSPDIERLVDDFVLLTFFVGNDFLPHLPTLDIGEQAFDVIFSAYRNLLRQSAGYIVKDGTIHDVHRLEMLCQIIGKQEVDILAARDDGVRSEAAKSSKSKGRSRAQVGPSLEEHEEMEEAKEAAYHAALLEALGKDVKQGPTGLVVPEETAGKDYRGRYYFEKFKVVPGTAAGDSVLKKLMMSYLEGLTWCMSYYMEGCVSWTWYFPFHYGPMLADMKDLSTMFSAIRFELGAPFNPFQQLLGCLPPLSAKLLPRSYQYLMTNDSSPLIEFYPLEFVIDANGKKAPWEAVVVLPFIDEVRLIEAEGRFCPASKLTAEEVKRNKAGLVCHLRYDPTVMDTYYSCNPEIGLSDIPRCNSRAIFSESSLAPGQFFIPELIPGTISPYPGFPSLGVIPITDIETAPIKVNVFGGESRYKTVVLSLDEQVFDPTTMDLGKLVGSAVWVNYPLVHEGRITAVSIATGEWSIPISSTSTTGQSMDLSHVGRKGSKPVEKEVVVASTPVVTFMPYDRYQSGLWKEWSVEEQKNYLVGRGIPGTGGINIGTVQVRIRVRVLQGMQRDPMTGKATKIFGESEADVPLQMALWSSPVKDDRFQETESATVAEIMPDGCDVIATAGVLRGMKGKVRHNKKTSLPDAPRSVDVEFSVIPPEPAFGHAIAASVADEYFSGRDLAKVLQISTSVLGKVVGAIMIDGTRVDLGLNLKRNGQYAMNGFCRLRELDEDGNPLSASSTQNWGYQDSVTVLGQAISSDAGDSGFWEYTMRAAALIALYKAQFPGLFSKLESLPHASKYSAQALFGENHQRTVNAINDLLQSQPFYSMPRTPLTSVSLSKDAVHAMERAADVRTASAAAAAAGTEMAPKNVLVESVPLDHLFRGGVLNATDAPLTYNDGLHPLLGDRVANLTSTGVPFGLRGTVVTIHKNTRYVEVVFDEEFIGGKSLGGYCSPFRGRLVPWAGVLCLSNKDEQTQASKAQKKIKTKTAKLAASEVKDSVPSKPAVSDGTESLVASLKNKLKIKGATPASLPPPPKVQPVIPIKKDSSGFAALLAVSSRSRTMEAGDDEDDEEEGDFESSHLLRAAVPMPMFPGMAMAQTFFPQPMEFATMPPPPPMPFEPSGTTSDVENANDPKKSKGGEKVWPKPGEEAPTTKQSKPVKEKSAGANIAAKKKGIHSAEIAETKAAKATAVLKNLLIKKTATAAPEKVETQPVTAEPAQTKTAAPAPDQAKPAAPAQAKVVRLIPSGVIKKKVTK